MASPMPTIGLKSAFERGGGYNSTYSLAGHCMSLLLLRALRTNRPLWRNTMCGKKVVQSVKWE